MPYSAAEWTGKTVLLTGASGMLGRAVLRLLQYVDVGVTAIVRSDENSLPGCASIVCDIRDLQGVEQVLASKKYDCVLHLAAQSQAGGYESRETFESNMLGTLNILEAAKVHQGNVTVVVASTDGASKYWNEFAATTFETVDVGSYAASKMCSEVIAQSYGNLGMKVGVVRLTNLYGPHDHNLRRLVPGTINALLSGKKPVFRSDPATAINVLYVDDAATAVLLFAGLISREATKLRTITIRNDESMTLREMVDAIAVAINEGIREKEDLRRNSDSIDRNTDWIEDWKSLPRTPLATGLKKTVNWYRRTSTE